MALPHMISLFEAALFTAGCAVLKTRRFEPERVGIALMAMLAALLAALLLTAVVTGAFEIDPRGPDDLSVLVE